MTDSTERIVAGLEEARRDLRTAQRKRARATEDEERCLERIKAIELVLREVLCIDVVPAPSKATEAADLVDELPSLAQAVRNVIDGITGQFTVETVRQQVETRWPELVKDEASIGGAVSRMVRVGAIKVVEAGRGRQPATYARKQENETESQPELGSAG